MKKDIPHSFNIKFKSKVVFPQPDVPTIKHLNGKGKNLLRVLLIKSPGIGSILCLNVYLFNYI